MTFVLSDKILFTTTVIGNIAGLPLFHERDLITRIQTKGFLDYNKLIRAKCNYGCYTSTTFQFTPTKQKSNRGRKKKTPKKNHRSKQGDGTCFNSQITFNIHENNNFYSIKVFRPGKYEINGLKTSDDSFGKYLLEYLIGYLKIIFDVENAYIETYKTIMKNYKFLLTSEEILNSHANDSYNYISLINSKKIYINMKKFYKTLLFCRNELEKYDPNHLPFMFQINYTTENTRIQLYFKTNRDLKAPTTLFMFYSTGRTNILGAKNDEDIDKMMLMLRNIVNTHGEYFIKKI